MLVWGGQDVSGEVGTGGRYNPSANSWASMTTTGAPAARYGHEAVWTGSFMIVWGGQDTQSVLGTGGRYAFAQSVDNDLDGLSECLGDCNDGDAAIWGTPGEATDLILSHAGSLGGSTTLNWTPPATGGTASGMRYDVLRSASKSDFTSGAMCLESDSGPDTAASDPGDPPPGGIFYYLVRAEDSCPDGEGILSFNSAGTPTSGRLCP
jgi:hypothetical protein